MTDQIMQHDVVAMDSALKIILDASIIGFTVNVKGGKICLENQHEHSCHEFDNSKDVETFFRGYAACWSRRSPFSLIQSYMDRDATHLKTGAKINETPPQERLEHLLAEVKELIAAPDDVNEMVDVAAILIHHILDHKLTEHDFFLAMKAKLKQRLECK